jgi:Methyltransferase domain
MNIQAEHGEAASLRKDDGERLRQKYRDPKSLYYRLRKARSKYVKHLIELAYAAKGSCRILDIGGEENYWRILDFDYLASRRVSITLINLDPQQVTSSMFVAIRGDACHYPFDDNAFDIAHSNSCIEHVGSWEDKVAFARQVTRVAPSYFVQTPNYWFPFEPHYRLPLVQYLPVRAQIELVYKLQRSAEYRLTSRQQAQEFVRHNSLLTRSEMCTLFPDSTILCERFMGLNKSLMAIKPAPSLSE